MSEQPRPEVETEFHGHVEPGHATDVDLNPREIMDRPVALSDHSGDLTHANLGAIGRIQRTPRMIPGGDDRENHRPHDGPKPIIKGAVDKNSLGCRRPKYAPAGHAAARISSAVRRGWLWRRQNVYRSSGRS